MRISLTLEVSKDRAAWCQTMPDDLVDRLIQQRKAGAEAKELKARLALERSKTVEENADWLWAEITRWIRFLVDKHNKAFDEKFSVDPSEADAASSSRIEVDRAVFPLVKLTLWRTSPHFLQFSIERTESSFAASKGARQRMEVKSDGEHNVYVVCQDGTDLRTPQAIAEYLLEPVLSAPEK